MDELDRPAPHQFILKKEIGAYDKQMTTNMLLAELAAGVAEHFGIVYNEGDEENDIPPSVSINFVGLHPETYEDLKEIEFNYRDLVDPAEDNAQEEGDEGQE